MKPTKQRPLPTPLSVALAIFIGCIPATLAVWVILAKRIEYSTGPSPSHDVLATPNSFPILYWTLTTVFCLSTLALWAKAILDLVMIRRSKQSSPNEK